MAEAAPRTLVEFIDHPRMVRGEGNWPYLDLTVEDLTAAGLTRDEVDLYDRTATTWSVQNRAEAVRSLATELSHLAVRHGQLLLRDAVAWVIVGDQIGSTAYFHADQWVEFGPTEHLDQGWRFLAAGIKPAEAHTYLDSRDGQVPCETLALMAGLRGITLPPVSADRAPVATNL